MLNPQLNCSRYRFLQQKVYVLILTYAGSYFAPISFFQWTGDGQNNNLTVKSSDSNVCTERHVTVYSVMAVITGYGTSNLKYTHFFVNL